METQTAVPTTPVKGTPFGTRFMRPLKVIGTTEEVQGRTIEDTIGHDKSADR